MYFIGISNIYLTSKLYNTIVRNKKKSFTNIVMAKLFVFSDYLTASKLVHIH